MTNPLASSPPGQWWRTPRGRHAVILGIVVVVLAGALASVYARYFGASAPLVGESNAALPNFTVNSGPALVTALLDGTQVESKRAERRALAVMIENHPDARPQAGVADASVVWEGIVEGGITRFMAIYSPTDASKIGPVRSARTQYVSWAAGYGALYAHAGGAQGALALIPTLTSIVDLPHTAAYFQREPQLGLASEHTLFTSTDQLYEFAREKDASLEASFEPLNFEREADLEDRPATAEVTVDFSTDTYKAHWTYERETNLYKRELAGQAHVDRVSGNQITANNIVVLVVARSLNSNTNGGKGEWSMTTEGTGKALVFKNGTVHEGGTWKKDSKTAMLRVLTESGTEIPLVSGKTWYEVVPPDREASVTHVETSELSPAS